MIAEQHSYWRERQMIQTCTFEVIGSQRIHCEGCEQAIGRSLTQLPGVRKAKADHRTQRIVVQMESTQTNAEAICARLDAAGYQVNQLPSAAPTSS
jgi:copper chaperone